MLSVLHALTQVAFDRLRRACIARDEEIVSIEKIEVDMVIVTPSFHEPVAVNVLARECKRRSCSDSSRPIPLSMLAVLYARAAETSSSKWHANAGDWPVWRTPTSSSPLTMLCRQDRGFNGRTRGSADCSATAVATKQVALSMTESSDNSDTPAKPQDHAGLRAELAALADDFTPLITELWPRLEDHK